MRFHAARRLAARLAREQSGFMIMEMIVVLAVLATVITPVVMSYTTGIRHEVDQTRRELAYQNARIALQRIRTDIHCASGALVEKNLYGGFTLNLTESPQTSSGGWCPGVVPEGDTTAGVQWCTIPYPGSTTRWKLYRFLGTSPTDCDGGAATTFLVDHLASTPGIWPQNANAIDAASPVGAPAPPTTWAGNLWPTSAACTTGRLPTVALNFNIAVDPDTYPNEHYQLIDEITMRNARTCP